MKSQWQLIADLFHSKGGTLTTEDFGRHPVLWAEYRRALCDLKKHGYSYTCTSIKRNLFRYELVHEPGETVFDSVGQGILL